MTAERMELEERLSVLAERPLPAVAPEVSRAQRARVVARMGAMLGSPPQRFSVRSASHRFWPAVAGVLLLAAGSALVLGASLFSRKGEVRLSVLELRGTVMCSGSQAKDWKACQGHSVEAARLHTLGGGSAHLRSPSGILMRLDGNSQVALVELGAEAVASQVTVERGRVGFLVPPLATGRSFSVTAPDLVVTVHGTAFSVEVRTLADGTTKSCVDITEGVVSVRQGQRELRLPAPSSFGCDRDPVELPSNDVASGEPGVAGSGSLPSQSVKPVRVGGAGERSTLVIEAKLLQLALGAERRGDKVLAEKHLNTLITGYPSSVVIPEAKAALSRLREHQRGLAP